MVSLDLILDVLMVDLTLLHDFSLVIYFEASVLGCPVELLLSQSSIHVFEQRH